VPTVRADGRAEHFRTDMRGRLNRWQRESTRTRILPIGCLAGIRSAFNMTNAGTRAAALAQSLSIH
jgi:hypothetical protein